jgi:hypothetical protein
MKNGIKKFLVIFVILYTGIITGQNILPNEISIFSFDTQNGKTVTLARDKNDQYIVYRFGTTEKIEFEFPEKTTESWNKFEYSYYLRGGGKQNEGMDLNFVAFTNSNFKYVLYSTYYATDEKSEVGIKVFDLKTGKITNIKGKAKTRKGTLVNFRFNKLLKLSDELYE